MSAVPARAAVPHDSHGRGDRWLILAQMLLGVVLVVFGALLAAFARAAMHDVDMAVIGIGATVLPAGVAESATSRIHHRYMATLGQAAPPPDAPTEAQDGRAQVPQGHPTAG